MQQTDASIDNNYDTKENETKVDWVAGDFNMAATK